jgi:hypothetical protein
MPRPSVRWLTFQPGHNNALYQLKSGGSEGDLMRLNGWKSRAMVDRYADDVANQRALEAKRRRGDMY